MDFQFSESDERFREEIAGFVESDLPWDWRTRSVDARSPRTPYWSRSSRRNSPTGDG